MNSEDEVWVRLMHIVYAVYELVLASLFRRRERVEYLKTLLMDSLEVKQ
jgi:hypothetical protein